MLRKTLKSTLSNGLWNGTNYLLMRAICFHIDGLKKRFYTREANNALDCAIQKCPPFPSMELKKLTLFFVQRYQPIMIKWRDFSQSWYPYTPYCFSIVESLLSYPSIVVLCIRDNLYIPIYIIFNFKQNKNRGVNKIYIIEVYLLINTLFWKPLHI